jgi:ABC-2 type transport system permease protein
MNNRQMAIIVKDLKEMIANKQVVWPMIIVPLVFVVIFPVGLIIAANYSVDILGKNESFIKNFTQVLPYSNDAMNMVYMAVNFMFPGFFIMIPIMTSSIIGGSSFITEKEHNTLETLFYSPLSIKEIFLAKVWGTFIPAYAITLLAFFIFGVIINVGCWPLFHSLIFPNLKWVILILWLSPAISFLGLLFMVLVSANATSFQEAQQKVGFVVIPVLVVIIGQSTGLFYLDELSLLIAGAVVFVVDYFMAKQATKNFTYEKLLK